MISIFDRLNLQPQERRLVVVALLVLFVFLNMWFVWPHFRQWSSHIDRLERARSTLRRYTNEVAALPGYESRLRVLERQGSAVLPAGQAVDMLRTVERIAADNHVQITYRGQPSRAGALNTNTFFEELTLPIRLTTAEKELVDFLFQLGSGDSMIRVRDLDLRPGVPPTNLFGQITLVATYQRTNALTTAPRSATAPLPAGTQATNRLALAPVASTTRPAPAATTNASTNIPSTAPRAPLAPTNPASVFPKITSRTSTNPAPVVPPSIRSSKPSTKTDP